MASLPEHRQTMGDIVKEIGKHKIVEYFRRLRHLGEKGRHIMRRTHTKDGDGFIQSTNTKQFVIATAVPKKDIIHQDFRILKNVLHNLYERNENNSFNANSTIFHHDTVVILLNDKTKIPPSHGEGTLLDPWGSIRKDVVLQEMGFKFKTEKSRTDTDYFFEIRSNSDELDPVILLFSYYIPCTLPYHFCAEIIKQFATKEDVRLIIAYDRPYEYTLDDDAFKTMMTYNSYVIPIKDPPSWSHIDSDSSLDYLDDSTFLQKKNMLRKRLITRRRWTEMD